MTAWSTRRAGGVLRAFNAWPFHARIRTRGMWLLKRLMYFVCILCFLVLNIVNVFFLQNFNQSVSQSRWILKYNRNVVMVALPNIGGALCSTPQFGWRPLLQCSNAAKTRKPLKFAGVPETRRQISAVSRPKFTILWGHVEEVSVFNNFFPIVDTCLSSKDTARQTCAMMPKWRFFASCISSVPRAAHFKPAF